MTEKIDSKFFKDTYDKDIRDQGIQFQVDNYFEPKESAMRLRIDEVFKYLDIQRDEKVLDLGCGVGTFAFHAAKRGSISCGVDYSLESIKAGKAIVEKFGMSDRIHYVRCDACRLPFSDNFFDKVISVDFIEHINIEEKDKCLREIRRVLKPQGTAAIFTPNAIREKIGEIYWQIRHLLFRHKIPTNELHFGLIDKFHYEPLLKKNQFSFQLFYIDITRPFLAKMPVLKHVLALELLWIAKKT